MGPVSRGKGGRADGQSYIRGPGDPFETPRVAELLHSPGDLARMPRQGVRRDQPGQGENSVLQSNLAYLAKPNVRSLSLFGVCVGVAVGIFVCFTFYINIILRY